MNFNMEKDAEKIQIKGLAMRILPLIVLAAVLVSCGKTSSPGNNGGPAPANSPTVNTNNGNATPTVPGNGPSNSPLSLSQTQPILFMSGGRGSCEDFSSPSVIKLTPFLTQYLAKAKAVVGTDVPYVLSCFASSGDDFGYSTSDNPTVLTKTTYQDFLTKFTSKLSQTSKGLNWAPYIVGHSYGGWLSMNETKTFSALPTVKIKMLATLDPISRINCQTLNYLAYILGQLGQIDFTKEVPGCNSAPTDFGDSGIQQMRSATDQWLNFYQTEFVVLHSGPIPVSDSNDLGTYGGNIFSDSHDKLCFDQNFHNKIMNAMVSSLQSSSNSSAPVPSPATSLALEP